MTPYLTSFANFGAILLSVSLPLKWTPNANATAPKQVLTEIWSGMHSWWIGTRTYFIYFLLYHSYKGLSFKSVNSIPTQFSLLHGGHGEQWFTHLRSMSTDLVQLPLLSNLLTQDDGWSTTRTSRLWIWQFGGYSHHKGHARSGLKTLDTAPI